MNTRKTRTKRVKISNDDFVPDFEEGSSISSVLDPDDLDSLRKSRIRDSNKEFARRMTILTTWKDYWSDYQTREGDAYPIEEAKNIIKRSKKILCPIQSCRKAFTTFGGLRYHYARCNIERTIRCLVCNPNQHLATRGELLRHMIITHSQDLPPLDVDQQEIVSSYFSCENKREKRERRVNIESESHRNSQSIVKSYFNLVEKNFQPQWSQQRPFLSWLSPARDWDLIIHVAERQKFYPPESESANVRISPFKDWINLKTGESTKLESDKRDNHPNFLFYTGGINTAIAWKPKSIYNRNDQSQTELIAIAVNSCSMEHSYTFKESHHNEGCIQFWTINNCSSNNNPNQVEKQEATQPLITLTYMIAHSYGTIFDMAWCPLGASWLPKEMIKDGCYNREGLLALACGDGQVRVLCIPDTEFILNRPSIRKTDNIIESAPMFRVKPIANLMPPGVGPSSDYQAMSCKSICWSMENGQKLIVAGYVNGTVALYDLSITSPILYMQLENRHVYQPLKSWFAHGAPVTSVAFSAFNEDKYLIATGSMDRQVKICNPFDLNATLVSDRAPVNKICWDFRFRGVSAATDHAFTSFNNKVSYKYPIAEGNHSITISSHRASVYGLDNSVLTSSIATSDQAGEVFVTPQLVNRTSHRREKNLWSVHSLYTMFPSPLKKVPLNLNVDNNPSDTIRPSMGDTQCSSIQVNSSITLQSNTEQEKSLTFNTIANIGNDTQLMANDQDVDEDGLDADADFSHVERTIANMPNKFLLPVEHRPVTTYQNFKRNFGIEYLSYDSIPSGPDIKVPESCLRAMDSKSIYCDRPCDYPFCSVNQVAWSPNPSSFSYLLSASQIGFCRLDRVIIVEQIFKTHIESSKPKISDTRI